MRRLFCAAFAVLIAPLAGCPASPAEPVTRENEAASVQAKPPAPPPSAGTTAEADKVAPASTPLGTAKLADPPRPAGSGTPADANPVVKVGGCASDADCSGGQVCDACGTAKCCAPGCHTDKQCSAGQKCKQVQCIRAPCPSQCSSR